MRKVLSILITITGLTVPILFNSCDAQHDEGSMNFSSLSANSCDQILIEGFVPFHNFLKTSCSNCHFSGGSGSGAFADDNIGTALQVFRAKGVDKISQFALNPSHKAPYTGEQNQSDIDSAKKIWAETQPNYNSCVASSGSGNSPSDPGPQLDKPTIFTTQKSFNAEPNNTTTITWNLDSDMQDTSSGLAGATFSIEVQTFSFPSSNSQGYYFSKPKFKPGNDSAEVFNIGVVINGQLVGAPYGATWQLTSSIVPAQTEREVSPNGGTMIVPFDIASNPTLGLAFGKLKITDVPFDPPTFTEVRSMVLNRCTSCHNANRRDGGVSFASYNSFVRRNGRSGLPLISPNQPDLSLVLARMLDTQAPMPPSGMLGNTELEMMRQWILDGAPNN